ncbi:GNAT family N-acetyltransferase [Cellulosimicrobium cellulans]|uniref:GNAT family N-acetyltransferase n=1 Tax=Cellulosimicrobium cellulans TaxID=1710 RepID=UPI0024069329|nr:GNAT family N-acetyltransferase [Cellulosimicrobium cellulans]MDF9875278.1 ribosomal protein S18 acetylase RimI-like enzyme [Cellulosimicrobium cellulans]
MTGSLPRVLPDGAGRPGVHVHVTVEAVPGDDAVAELLRTRQQAELAVRYGEPDAGTFVPDASIANVVVRSAGEPVAFVALRDVSGAPDGRGGAHPPRTGEVKRLWVEPAHRGRGHARTAMRAAHRHAVEAGLDRLVLETGTLQPESIDLYLSLGYVPIESYGHYAGHPLSRCFALDLGTADPGVGTDAADQTSVTSGGRGARDARRAATPNEPVTVPAPGVVEVRAVPWDDPDAATLRREMHETSSAVLYPELFAGLDAAGGFDAVDARVGAEVVATLVAYRDGVAVGCASLRRPAPGAPVGALEVKKVFVRERARRTGTARRLLDALEAVARERGVGLLLLETGIRQPGAIALYRSLGYRAVEQFPPYVGGNHVALCFAKPLA